MRSKLSFKSPQQAIDNANVSIRMQKDSLIWLSISKLGIEGARVLIARDSVRILDKINRQYAVADYGTISRQFRFPLSFEWLQALLVGNLPMPNQPAQKYLIDVAMPGAHRMVQQIQDTLAHRGVQRHQPRGHRLRPCRSPIAERIGIVEAERPDHRARGVGLQRNVQRVENVGGFYHSRSFMQVREYRESCDPTDDPLPLRSRRSRRRPA